MPSWKKVIVSGSDASFNSLYVLGGAISDGGFTGSLLGTASTASFVTGSDVWGPFGSNSIISASYASTASYALAIPDQGFNFSQPTLSNTWIINHNLDTLTPLVNVYDLSYHQLIPADINAISANTIEITFSSPRAGYAIVSKGSGVSATTIATASFAVSASYSISASYAENVRTVCYTATTSSGIWTIPHNFGCKYVMVNVYNGSDDAIIPNRINLTDSNTTTIYFTVPTAGTALLIPANCCGTPTTTTTSTTTTTTTAAPTTTTSTTTSTTTTVTPTTTTSTTTSTTTAGFYTYTLYGSIGYSNAGDACSNQPTDSPSTVYAAEFLIGSVTRFYSDSTLTTPIVGGDQWWAFGDGVQIYRAQISNGGFLSNNASC